MQKRISFLLIVLVLLGCFSACGKGTTPTSVSSEGKESQEPSDITRNPAGTGGTETDEPGDNEPYSVTEAYLPASVWNFYTGDIVQDPSAYRAYYTGNAPYCIQDVYTVCNCRLKSITVPVFQTGAADANGDLFLTLYAFGNSNGGLRQAARRQWVIRVGTDAYGLPENSSLLRTVTIDLTAYEIELAEDETLGVFSDGDTIFPTYIPAGTKTLQMAADFPQAFGFLSKVGSTSVSSSGGVLLLDFTWERSYESKEAYWAERKAEEQYLDLLERLRTAYAGKRLSVLGDSISTYGGFSDDTQSNSTIGDNAVYYQAGQILPDVSATYWGRLLQELDMRLCVANAWSGSRVYGNAAFGYADSAVLRAGELDHDNGTPDDPSDDLSPNVILFYMGINDLHNRVPCGNLYGMLTNAEPEAYRAVTDAWMEELLERTAQGTQCSPGEYITGFAEAYAMALYQMRQAYPDAEIFCLNLVPNNESRYSQERADEYNLCIEALTAYFGAVLVDQVGLLGVTADNCFAYASDVQNCVHPNVAGHARMTRLLVEAMTETLGE